MGPFFIDVQGFAWSAYGWNFSANWNDVTQICSIGEWRDRLQYVTIVARPGAIIARPRVPRFVYHRRVPWKKWAPGLQALDIQCGPQFLDVPPPYLENLLKFFIERPEDRVRLSRREGLELGLFVFEGVVGGSYRCDWWVVVWVRRCGGGGRGPLMMGAAYSPVMRTSTWLTLPSPVLT